MKVLGNILKIVISVAIVATVKFRIMSDNNNSDNKYPDFSQEIREQIKSEFGHLVQPLSIDTAAVRQNIMERKRWDEVHEILKNRSQQNATSIQPLTPKSPSSYVYYPIIDIDTAEYNQWSREMKRMHEQFMAEYSERSNVSPVDTSALSVEVDVLQ